MAYRMLGSGPHTKLPQFRLPLLEIVLLISLMMTWNSMQTLSLLQMPDQAGKPRQWLVWVRSAAQAATGSAHRAAS